MESSKINLFALLILSMLLAAVSGANVSAQEMSVSYKTRLVEFDTDEGTAMHIDVSPDGQSILFDLLGDLYTVGISGGDAQPIATGRSWDTQPRFSRDGKWIAFVSDRDGSAGNVWVMDAHGQHARPVTRDRLATYYSPAWMPDNRTLIAARDSFGKQGQAIDLWSADVTTGKLARLELPGTFFSTPAVSETGQIYYASSTGFRESWHLCHSGSNDHHSNVAADDVWRGYAPRFSRDGTRLAYLQVTDSLLLSLRVRDLSTGVDRIIVPALERATHVWRPSEMVVVPSFAFLPDGQTLVVAYGGHLHRVGVGTGIDTVIPFRAHVRQEIVPPFHVPRRIDDGAVPVRTWRWPVTTADGRKLIFSAMGSLWEVRPGDTQPKRVTDDSVREYTPSLSPDGLWLAYTTWSDDRGGAVIVGRSDGTDRHELHLVKATPRIAYLNPAWSPDSRRLVVVRAHLEMRDAGPVARPDTSPFDIVTIARDNSAPPIVAPYRWSEKVDSPSRYPVPVFSADGRRVLFLQQRSETGTVFGSSWLVSMHPNGTNRTIRMKLTPNAAEGLPSPDERQIAISWHHEIWVAALPLSSTAIPELTQEQLSRVGLCVSRDGGEYMRWESAHRLTWVIGDAVYRYDTVKHTVHRITDTKLSVPRTAAHGLVAYVGGRVITMRGDEVFERGSVLVRDDRIVAVGPTDSVRVPEEATVVSTVGLTVIPGLIDVHDHVHLWELEIIPQRSAFLAGDLAHGVTTSYDPAALSTTVFTEAEMADAGRLLGPRQFSSGDVIRGISPEEEDFTSLAELDDARRVVRRLTSYGAIMLKEYFQPRRDQRQWLQEAAREQEVLLTAEGGQDTNLDLTLVVDGYPAFEHGFIAAPLYRDVITLMAQAQTLDTPTFEADTVGNRAEETRATAALMRAGVAVCIGSHGKAWKGGTQQEMFDLQMGGLTPLEVLRAATLNGARKIGLDKDLGSIESGKLADMVFLDGNPLQNFAAITQIFTVIKAGVRYGVDPVRQLLPDDLP